MIPLVERLTNVGHCEIVVFHGLKLPTTRYGFTQTLEPVAEPAPEPAQPLECTPRYPGFIFAFTGFLVLSFAWIRMLQTSSTVDFLEWFAIGVGFFMLAYVRRDWVRGGM